MAVCILKDELGHVNFNNLLPGFNSSNVCNLKHMIGKELEQLERSLHASYERVICKNYMTQWEHRPYELLADTIGCTKQCPFCVEPCDLRDPDHYKYGFKHRTGSHRPVCLAGWRDSSTLEMEIEF